MKSHVRMTNKERKAMEDEMQRQASQWAEKLRREVNDLVAITLHRKLGYGEKRITDFLVDMKKNAIDIPEGYEIEDDFAWLIEFLLKEDGIDMGKVYSELEKE